MLFKDRYALHQHLPCVTVSKSFLPRSIASVMPAHHTDCYCEMDGELFLPLVCPREAEDQRQEPGLVL